jgi:hypothetical protein
MKIQITTETDSFTIETSNPLTLKINEQSENDKSVEEEYPLKNEQSENDKSVEEEDPLKNEQSENDKSVEEEVIKVSSTGYKTFKDIGTNSSHDWCFREPPGNWR